MKREICAVVTKGTLTDGEMLSASPDTSYLMAITESCQSSVNQQEKHVYGICAVDVATSKIMLGQVCGKLILIFICTLNCECMGFMLQ